MAELKKVSRSKRELKSTGGVAERPLGQINIFER
jgi:hypothetical protein